MWHCGIKSPALERLPDIELYSLVLESKTAFSAHSASGRLVLAGERSMLGVETTLVLYFLLLPYLSQIGSGLDRSRRELERGEDGVVVGVWVVVVGV